MSCGYCNCNCLFCYCLCACNYTMADDTIVLAESAHSLQKKMHCLLECSKKIYQVPNISKTAFCHFSDNPLLHPLYIDANTLLSSVEMQKGHRYLGMKFHPTNNLNKIISSNLNERASNWCKFYSWLEVNEETPIEIKILVLGIQFDIVYSRDLGRYYLY